jgi:hypothetical protein
MGLSRKCNFIGNIQFRVHQQRLNLFALLRVNSSKWRPVLSQPLATAHIDSTVGTQRKNELEEDEGPRIYCGGRGQCLGNLNDAARMRQTT